MAPFIAPFIALCIPTRTQQLGLLILLAALTIYVFVHVF